MIIVIKLYNTIEKLDKFNYINWNTLVNIAKKFFIRLKAKSANVYTNLDAQSMGSDSS